MDDRKTRRSTYLFVTFLLLAGIAYIYSRSGIPILEALMTSCNYLIYQGLLLFWFQSVRARLLPSRAKNGVISAALLLLLYQLLRVFKYRFATEPTMTRYLAYLIFAPMTLIPTLFLITCLRIRRGNQPGRLDDALLLIPPCLLSLLAITNDFHFGVYAPKVILSDFAVVTDTYTRGPVFYAIYAWIILSFATGLSMLFLEAELNYRKALPGLILVVMLWFTLLTVYIRVFDGTRIPRMYNSPEIHLFGMLGIFEVCIRSRMIPYNEDYLGFFSTLKTPALVADMALQPVYHSGAALSADTKQLRAALMSPIYLTPDLKLCGRDVRGGYAFWVEDESEVHRAQKLLADANEIIESENSLIQAETEQREKDAWLQSRHRIYHEIAEIMYPCQQRIAELLGSMNPGAQTFREQLAYVSVLNAYVKRKTNLLLLSEEQERLTIQTLFLALKESASYLSLAGLRTEARQPEEERSMPAGMAIALYDAFEAVAEQLIGNASSLMVSAKGSGIALATETTCIPCVKDLPVPVWMREEEGILYMDFLAEVRAKKGGEQT